MWSLGAFAFANPWVLVALAVLPALWWLLRATPPAAQRVRFPAVRLLLGLTPREETAARTPWWLLALRLLIAALLITGLAGPVVHPAATIPGSGPLVMVVDDGWAAGATWTQTQRSMQAWLDRAARADKRVVLMTTAPDRPNGGPEPTRPLTVDAARERVNALTPQPWPRDLEAAAEAVDGMDVNGSAAAVWFNDGLAASGAEPLARRLQRLGRLTVVQPAARNTAQVVLPPDPATPELTVRLRRADAGPAQTRTVHAADAEGRVIGTATATFAEGEMATSAAFDMPLTLRNRVARVRIAEASHPGAVALLDGRWTRRRVGLAQTGEEGRPLLSPGYYLARAVSPFAEIARGPVGDLMDRELSVLMLPDRGRIPQARRGTLENWVRGGGVLVRFAGPRMAAALAEGQAMREAGSPLLPVALRRGGRALGGAMSWEEPARIGAFPDAGPLAGLPVPGEVRVHKQVLAQPGPELDARTWARLGDGTPLVTGARRGDGWVVLVHTTADASWSDLPLSGTYVRILRRLTQLGAGLGSTAERPLPPAQLLDGFGELVPAGGAARALPADPDASPPISPAHPPGLYGRGGERRAHNLGPRVAELTRLTELPRGVVVQGPDGRPETRIGPWLLAAALGLWLVDVLIALALRGLLRGRRMATAVVALAVVLPALALAPEVRAQTDGSEAFARKAALSTRLAYLETGVTSVDRTTRAGLAALSGVLTRRTSVEPADPMAADPASDPLEVFPMLYWAITPDQPALSARAAENLTRFLRSGGTLVIDLRAPGAGEAFGDGSPASRALQRLTAEVPIPPLQPVGADHVLTKTFYLLETFPGRTTGGEVWVEDTGRTGDEVASVIIGANDWAGAWAVDEQGNHLHAVAPGGARQREMAYRVGVNLVMYALTGTYKADQVHVPAILERLGQ
ncbi:N-terminal double-transmembrane domain-containing protein [Limimonas halophila]|uniref:N-terminal double-transmembrane domain-containing protein n=1 Tax=Limimonas halophila TaxID=1082479 RepID=A0A1G7LBU5_9PROT|nr:DUF4159 domain-containing protein [Limimonas halophila]SDF46774.1 N-terminal double-transmembrane domain-containing protein [Limimonas halophila]